jgi:hypothetical protein
MRVDISIMEDKPHGVVVPRDSYAQKTLEIVAFSVIPTSLHTPLDHDPLSEQIENEALKFGIAHPHRTNLWVRFL